MTGGHETFLFQRFHSCKIWAFEWRIEFLLNQSFNKKSPSPQRTLKNLMVHVLLDFETTIILRTIYERLYGANQYVYFEIAALFHSPIRWGKKRGNFKANIDLDSVELVLYCLSSSPNPYYRVLSQDFLFEMFSVNIFGIKFKMKCWLCTRHF